jgi:hypothetical protein
VISAVAGLAAAASMAGEPLLPPVVSGECEAATRLRVGIESALFSMMPADEQARIAAGMARQEAERLSAGFDDEPYEVTDERYAKVAHVISREKFEEIRPLYRRVMVTLAERAEQGATPVAACFAPDADPEVAMALSELLYNQASRFQQTDRWTSTALSGGGLGQGDPTILTYGFVPDGTFVPDLIGGASGNSQLFTWLNGIYGSPATWQPIFDQVFDRWEELSGTTYVYEPNDDGSNLNGASGVSGVRADLRIAAISIDGNSGILAYNNFPNDGDMVLDAFDSFYNSIGNNSLRLRNIIAHEHGHGKGMLHVCPANQTKLMEPFISTAYDGPQHDDILNAQRHYGDPLEIDGNDTAGDATPLGEVGFPGIVVSQISIDDNSDDDWFSVVVPEPSEIIVSVTPTGETYTQGPQTSACNSGSTFNSLVIHDLSIAVFDTDGSTQLGFADNTGDGGTEALNVIAENPGTYFIRVTGDSTNSVQLYNLTATVDELPFLPLGISLVTPVPEAVDPGVTTQLTLTIDPRDETIAPGSEVLRYRDDGGSFQTIALTPAGGMNYTATLPAAMCGSSPEFFFQVTGDMSGTVSLPSDGAANPFSALVGQLDEVFADNFETNQGWTVSGPVSGQNSGQWERGVPQGDGSRGDAPVDFDGSGQCYLTGNGGPGSNTDVDGGQTILTSPTFDASGSPEATISYARWYNNVAGDSPNADVFTVQISNNNGGAWTNLEVVGPAGPGTSGGWIEAEFRIADFVTPTANMRVRFIAEDAGAGSVVEAAVDAISVGGLTCEDPVSEGCNAADLAEPFGVLDFSDVVAFLGAFGAMDSAADLAAPTGVFDFSDVVAYLGLFGGGCP